MRLAHPLACVLMMLCAASVTSAADERTAAREHFARGTKAFDLGQYDEAIREYMEAYKAKDAPEILYNIGQAHRLAGHNAEALRFYKVYVTKVPQAPNRDEVLRKIEELEKVVEHERRATHNLPPDQTLPRPPEGAPSRPDVGATAAPAASISTASRQSAGRSKRIAGVVVGGVGLGALGAGIAFGVLARNASDELSRADIAMMPFDASKERAGNTFQILEGVFLGIGGAAVVAGTVVYVLGLREGRGAHL